MGMRRKVVWGMRKREEAPLIVTLAPYLLIAIATTFDYLHRKLKMTQLEYHYDA